MATPTVPGRILLVDDDPAIRESLAAALDPTRYVLVSAADGASALAVAEVFSPEVVLLDLGLPDIQGPISEVFIAVNTAPTGANVIVDVNTNGTTIFTNQANRPEIAASANTDSTVSIDVNALAAGEYLTIDVDQIGSALPGSDLVVHIISN